MLSRRGYHLVVVSNQSGIAKEFYTREALHEITRRMIQRVERHGGHLDLVLYCPHRDQDSCRCRKPKPGLVRRALRELNLRRPRMVVVGDARRDIEMGRRVDATTVLVLCGRTTPAELATWTSRPHHVAQDLLAAARWIVREGDRR